MEYVTMRVCLQCIYCVLLESVVSLLECRRGVRSTRMRPTAVRECYVEAVLLLQDTRHVSRATHFTFLLSVLRCSCSPAGYIPFSAVQLLCVSMSSNYSHIFTCVLPRSSLEIALSALRTHRATSMVINIRGCTRGSKSLMVGARKHPGVWRCAAA